MIWWKLLGPWNSIFVSKLNSLLVSTCERLSVMHKQVSGWTVNFCPNFPESPFLEFQTRKPPPHFGKVPIWVDQSLLRNTPPFWKSSDLRWPKFTLEYPPPPILEKFRFEMTKVYSGIPPISEKFRFEMTKVYSGIPPPRPHFGKVQIWDDQSLLRNTPPISEKFRFEMTKVYSGIPPSPPFWKSSDLRWPEFTPEYPPPISENAGDRMWRLICNPQGYHSLPRCCIWAGSAGKEPLVYPCRLFGAAGLPAAETR